MQAQTSTSVVEYVVILWLQKNSIMEDGQVANSWLEGQKQSMAFFDTQEIHVPQGTV